MSTAIEWTHRPGTKGEVWNPVTGCTKVSAGCTHCYAESVATRFWGARKFTDVRCHDDRLEVPLGWRKPRTVFVNSMSDLFHDAVPDEFIDRVFAAMALCPQHTFIVLTKRPKRMREYLLTLGKEDGDRKPIIPARIVDARDRVMSKDDPRQVSWNFPAWPLPNVWLGVSVEDQATADARIPLLLKTPAEVHFVSAEPLLGPVDLDREYFALVCGGHYPFPTLAPEHRSKVVDLIDWLIVGGESGPQARPCHVEWIRSLRDQAKAAGVPCFIKQLGSCPVVQPSRQQHWDWRWLRRSEDQRFTLFGDDMWRIHTFDSKGAAAVEWPTSLRVREWPAQEVA